MADAHGYGHGDGQGPEEAPERPNPWAAPAYTPPAGPGYWGAGSAQPSPPWAQPAPWAPVPPPPPPLSGEPTGGLSEPGPPFGPVAPSANPRRDRRRASLLAAGFVATAVAFGGAGVGIGLAVAAPGSGSTGTNEPLPTAAKSSPSSNTVLNVAAVAARVEPATVDITATGSEAGTDEGTGMVLTSSGIVLTNNHVVEGSTQLTAQVDGTGTVYSATVLGVDPVDDVALLQLHGASTFKTVTLGNSGAIRVGEPVVAIGNALALSGPETVTSGIISATGRSVSISDPSSGINENLKGLFQTSATINPGNSGGPLVDAAGQVIGMNTASAQSTGSDEPASNIGFAIPVNSAMAIARQIQEGKASSTVLIGANPVIGGLGYESVACAEGTAPGCIGLGDPFSGFGFASFGYTAPVNQGAVISGIDESSPVAAAGMAVGDVIISVDGHAVADQQQLSAQLAAKKVGQKVTLGWVDQERHEHSSVVALVAGPTL